MKPRSVSTGSTQVDKAIDHLRGAIPDLDVFEGARLIEDVQLTAGSTVRIAHGLKRKLRGWLVVRTDSGAALGYIYDQQGTAGNKPDVYLYLRAEGYSPTVSLLVF